MGRGPRPQSGRVRDQLCVGARRRSVHTARLPSARGDRRAGVSPRVHPVRGVFSRLSTQRDPSARSSRWSFVRDAVPRSQRWATVRRMQRPTVHEGLPDGGTATDRYARRCDGVCSAGPRHLPSLERDPLRYVHSGLPLPWRRDPRRPGRARLRRSATLHRLRTLRVGVPNESQEHRDGATAALLEDPRATLGSSRLWRRQPAIMEHAPRRVTA